MIKSVEWKFYRVPWNFSELNHSLLLYWCIYQYSRTYGNLWSWFRTLFTFILPHWTKHLPLEGGQVNNKMTNFFAMSKWRSLKRSTSSTHKLYAFVSSSRAISMTKWIRWLIEGWHYQILANVHAFSSPQWIRVVQEACILVQYQNTSSFLSQNKVS